MGGLRPYRSNNMYPRGGPSPDPSSLVVAQGDSRCPYPEKGVRGANQGIATPRVVYSKSWELYLIVGLASDGDWALNDWMWETGWVLGMTPE